MRKFLISLLVIGFALALPLSSLARGDDQDPERESDDSGVEVELHDSDDGTGDDSGGRLEEFRERLREHREDLEESREEARENIEAKRNELRDSLERISDERKRAIVERIDQQLDIVNQRHMNRVFNILDRLEGFLLRIESRADIAEENGHDVSDVRAAIAEASGAIAEARAAAENQAAQTYTLEIVDEQTLGEVVSAARQALHDDLETVRGLVRGAMEAVRAALRSLRDIPRVDELESSDHDDDNGGDDSDSAEPANS